MAGIASSFWRPPTSHRRSGTSKLIRQPHAVSATCRDRNQREEEEAETRSLVHGELGSTQSKRRQVLLGMTLTTSFAAFSSAPFISDSSAETDVAEGFRVYTDGENKFKMTIPEGWRVGVGEGEPNGFKSVTAFYPEETTSSNVSVIITGVGPDFTKMESFGKVDEFAQTLVSGLDRSWKRPPGVAAKLIDSKSKNGFYYIDYWLQNPGESRKYLYSALGMASNGWYNRLYTVTGQFEEGDTAKYGSAIEKAVASFRFT